MAIPLSNGLRALFSVLGCLMVATLIYTIYVDGFPFRRDLLTPWMAATLVDFYINTIALAVPLSFSSNIHSLCFLRFRNMIRASTERILWWLSGMDLLQGIELYYCNSLDSSANMLRKCQDLLFNLFVFCSMSSALQRAPTFLFNFSSCRLKNLCKTRCIIYYCGTKTIAHALTNRLAYRGVEQKTKQSAVVTARIAFSILGLLMLGTLIYTLITDGSPFRKELLTPWMIATLIDFYINVVALSVGGIILVTLFCSFILEVWVAYKESSWISAFLWILLLICFGSITTCAYIVKQLLQLTSQDPVYLILFNRGNRQVYDLFTLMFRHIQSHYGRKMKRFNVNYNVLAIELASIKILISPSKNLCVTSLCLRKDLEINVLCS
ncbi:hypothetical protein POTOM_009682 [Populus tomentosa]|uniref:Uncharacterized protein n=1 Tax=Populus tomentosa TaxID=118781 RepID=A0A8X8AN94_POPTO|nr:hypothetical protein POTOM_009682 [Populus tomentosa]